MRHTIWHILVVCAAGAVTTVFGAAPQSAADPTDCPNYQITGFCAPGDSAPQPAGSLVPPPDYADDGASPVVGGGPVGVYGQRIVDQLPTFQDAYTMNGQTALGFASKVMRFNPETKAAFFVLDKLANCVGDRGVWAARAYAAHDLSWAGGVAVISANAMHQLGDYLVQCVTGGAVSGGGPGGGLMPCFDNYRYSISYPDAPDTYTAFVFGIPHNVCSMIKQTQVGYT